jgi:hypothetical protein
MNDLDLVTICQALYSDQVDGYWTRLWPHDCGMAALKRVNNKYDVVVWRGSTTLDDWLADLNTEPVTDPKLGPVHQGFLQGVLDLAPSILQAIARPAYVCGHSLGAGHALLHAGFLKLAGEDILGVTTWGTPRPSSGPKLSTLLWNTKGHDYRNRSDAVTDVPFGWGYQHPRALTDVDVEPSLGDSWGILANHHISLYHTAMQGLFQPTVIP